MLDATIKAGWQVYYTTTSWCVLKKIKWESRYEFVASTSMPQTPVAFVPGSALGFPTARPPARFRQVWSGAAKRACISVSDSGPGTRRYFDHGKTLTDGSWECIPGQCVRVHLSSAPLCASACLNWCSASPFSDPSVFKDRGACES